MAAMTENEFKISNKSYINKDFDSVYEELLSAAETISKRFSPVNSNETDPFIILLKLMAFVTDKVNYNTDKNVLERFMMSCTQQMSMNELTSMMGYNMHYYVGAETSAVFRYAFPEDSTETEISIPRFSNIKTNDEIQFVTLRNALIDKSTGTSMETPVLQGVLKIFSVLDSDLIQLENIDSRNRLYFPESMVAENGVFLTTSDSNEEWQKVDNLNIQQYLSLVYKFGYDSLRGLPFIEFPEWVSKIIGSGLSMKYVVTQGAAGNVPAKSLQTLSRLYKEDKIADEDIAVTNTSAAISGRDPESIDEAYSGFKRTIGTFETLVTCRDYANAIVKLLDSYGNKIVGNASVGDRRQDINYSSSVLTYDSLGARNVDIISKTEDDKNVIDPFDLCVYATKPILNKTLYSLNKQGGYNDCFTPISQNAMEQVKNGLEEQKTLSHEYKQLKNTDVFSIQNNYQLDVIVSTNNKVNVLEASNIIENIKNALINKYNSSEVSFGEQIVFDEMQDVILNADPQIRSVSLREPIQIPKVMLADGTVLDLTVLNDEGELVETDTFKMILAKNILSGRVQLFEYDDTFEYGYSAENYEKYENVEKISTYTNIGTVTSSSPFAEVELRANEVIQFLAPSLVTDVTYPYGQNYHLKLDDSDKKFIPANTEYILQSGDELVFTYLDNAEQTQIVPYGAGEIIKPNFDMYTTAALLDQKRTPTILKGVKNNKYPTQYQGDGWEFYTLSTNDQVEHRTVEEEKITRSQKCYWLVNGKSSDSAESNNFIDWQPVADGSSECFYLLKDNEYFFRSDNDLISLHSFGPGTKLIILASMVNDSTGKSLWTHQDIVDIEEVTNKGLLALKDVFKQKVFTEEKPLTIIRNEIYTLLEGAKINWSTLEESIDVKTLPNYGPIGNSKISFMNVGDTEWTELPDRSALLLINQWTYNVFLDINCSADLAQAVNNGQLVELTLADGSTAQITGSDNTYFQLNSDVQINGGSNIDVSYYDLYQEKKYLTALTKTENTEIANDIQRIDDDHFAVSLQGSSGEEEPDCQKLYVGEGLNENKCLMVYVPEIADSPDAKCTISAYNSIGEETAVLHDYSKAVNASENLELSKSIDMSSGMHMIRISQKNASSIPVEILPGESFTPNEPGHAAVLKAENIGAKTKISVNNPGGSESAILGLKTKDPISLSTDTPFQFEVANHFSSRTGESDTNESILDNITFGFSNDPAPESSTDTPDVGITQLRLVHYIDSSTGASKDQYSIFLNNGRDQYSVFDDTGNNQVIEEIFKGKTSRISVKTAENEDGINFQIQNSGGSASVDIIGDQNGDNFRDYTEAYIIIGVSYIKDISMSLDLVNNGVNTSYVTLSSSSDMNITLSKLKAISGINPYLGIKEKQLDEGQDVGDHDYKFITWMRRKYPEQFKKFYMIAPLENIKQIQLNDTFRMDSAQAFYDKNNIANKWTIPKIDFTIPDIKKGITGSTISVALNCMR